MQRIRTPHLYFVTFTVRNLLELKYLMYHICAPSAKEAIEKAKAAWAATGDTVPHPFGLCAKRATKPLAKLSITAWNGDRYAGKDLYGRFYCLYTRIREPHERIHHRA